MITSGGYYSDEEEEDYWQLPPLIVPLPRGVGGGIPAAPRYTDARMERAAWEGEEYARHVLRTGLPAFLKELAHNPQKLHEHADAHFTKRKFKKEERLIAISHFVETFQAGHTS